MLRGGICLPWTYAGDVHCSSSMTCSTSAFEYIWNKLPGVMTITSTFDELSFSSMTCFSVRNAKLTASLMVMLSVKWS